MDPATIAMLVSTLSNVMGSGMGGPPSPTGSVGGMGMGGFLKSLPQLMQFLSAGREKQNSPRRSRNQPGSKTAMASTPTGGIITLPPPSNFPFDMPMMNPILGRSQGSSIYA